MDPITAAEPGALARRSFERLRAQRPASGGRAPGDLARMLEIVAGPAGAAVIHDVRDGREGAIDHIVIGPAGVCVIDAKTWSGTVNVVPGGLYRGKYSGVKHLRSLEQRARRVRDVLERGKLGDVPIESALCLVNGARGLGADVTRVGGHAIGRIDAVAAHAIRPGPLAPAEVTAVVDVLRSAFRVGGAPARRTERGSRRRSAEVLALGALAVSALAMLADSL